MTTFTVHTPLATPTPRGARAVGWLISRLSAVLDGVRQRRAARAEQMRSVSRLTEASALRRHAQGFMGADPRFAADLFAAADRHERQE
jgi:hypothetical protein